MQSVYLFNSAIVMYLMFSQNMIDAKSVLDSQLYEWKPKVYHLGARGIDPVKVMLFVDVLAMSSYDAPARLHQTRTPHILNLF